MPPYPQFQPYGPPYQGMPPPEINPPYYQPYHQGYYPQNSHFYQAVDPDRINQYYQPQQYPQEVQCKPERRSFENVVIPESQDQNENQFQRGEEESGDSIEKIEETI